MNEGFNFRAETARQAMLKMIETGTENGIYPDPEEVCRMAVLYADNLMKILWDNAD